MFCVCWAWAEGCWQEAYIHYSMYVYMTGSYWESQVAVCRKLYTINSDHHRCSQCSSQSRQRSFTISFGTWKTVFPHRRYTQFYKSLLEIDQYNERPYVTWGALPLGSGFRHKVWTPNWFYIFLSSIKRLGFFKKENCLTFVVRPVSLWAR